MFAFSTCWNSHRHIDGREMLLEIRALGFEYAELGHGVSLSLIDGIQRAVAAKEIKISSLHNFCPLPLGVTGPAPDYYLPSSPRERERFQAVRHTLRTIECAAMVGARAVVLHLGQVPIRHYTRKLLWYCVEGKMNTPRFTRVRSRALARRARKQPRHLEAVYQVLEAVLPRAKEAGVRLGMETRFGIEDIPDADETEAIIARFGPEVIAYWHDIGHAQVKESLGLATHESWLERFRGRTLGMHLQDVAAPAADHRPPGRGDFDFRRLIPFISPDMVLAWEIHPEWPAEEIRDRLAGTHRVLRPTAP